MTDLDFKILPGVYVVSYALPNTAPRESFGPNAAIAVGRQLPRETLTEVPRRLCDSGPLGKVGQCLIVRRVFACSLGVPEMEKLDGYLRIKDAAEFLGVSPNTLRNWGRDGKITEQRHPINNYRLYKKTDLERLLRLTEKPEP